MLVAVVVAGARIQAWNPATHIFIAQQVYPNVADKINLSYGAIGPDLSIYVTAPDKWPSAFVDTHWLHTDLRPWAWTATQRAFVRGWKTHSEGDGADMFAHGVPDAQWVYHGGYVTEKTIALMELPILQSMPADLVHMLVEAAVDLNLKHDVPWVSRSLVNSVVFRSWEDPDLLTRAFVWWPLRKTDWLTLNATEVTYRQISYRYATALNKPEPENILAVATVGLELAKQVYPDLPLTEREVAGLLQFVASHYCQDYQLALTATINGIPKW
jgi:hypothetical protein